MKRCTKCGIEKEATVEFFGKNKYGLTARCKTCTKQYNTQYHKDHIEEHNQRNKQYRIDNCESVRAWDRKRSKQRYLDNPETCKQYSKQWKNNNKNRVAAKNAEWYRNNIEHCKEVSKLWAKNNIERQKKKAKEWATNNRDKCNMKHAKRRAMKLNQTPQNADIEKIQFIYEVASTMVDYHVDHIQPLSKGGLHHENNLQILKANLNMEKKDKWPLTPEEQIKYKGYRIAQ